MHPTQFLMAGLAAAMLSSLAAADDAVTERPNVLMIAIDDLNDWIGCLGGHPQVQTPHMDGLAARGTVFINAHCQSPLCNPSRTSLLTGLRPSTTGIYTLRPGLRTVPALQGTVTLPQHFHNNGYYTYGCGKIFHDGAIPREQRGREFEVWGPAPGMVRPPEKFVHPPDDHPLMDWGPYPPEDNMQADWRIADAGIEQIRNAPDDRPFFISVGFRLPHVPLFASQKWFDLYPEDEVMLPPYRADDRDDVPEFSWYLYWKLPEPRLSWVREADQWTPLVRAYLATVSFVDSQVGRVLDALEESGLADNTVVCLWSDHGWHLGEKDITGKNTLWDRSAHVPLIFAGPGVSSGGICSQPAELLDIYPTLIDLCGLGPRGGLEGHSLSPQLADAAAERPWPAITTHNKDNHGVRSERWRYIRYADGSEELYDMENDPNEWTNLAGHTDYADVVAEHAAWLPQINQPAVEGSAARLLEQVDGEWYWEGEKIDPAEKRE